MNLIQPDNEIYLVISGKYKGKTCILYSDQNLDPFVTVIFCDNLAENKTDTIEKGLLCKLQIPGWGEYPQQITYTLAEYLSDHKDSGRNAMRMSDVAHPIVLKQADMLATGEIVSEYPRRGYNGSVLVCLENAGWIELASRFPIALLDNKKFKLPIDLKAGDKLITECTVDDNSCCTIVNWTNIFIDGNRFKIPSCVPLALA